MNVIMKRVAAIALVGVSMTTISNHSALSYSKYREVLTIGTVYVESLPYTTSGGVYVDPIPTTTPGAIGTETRPVAPESEHIEVTTPGAIGL